MLQAHQHFYKPDGSSASACGLSFLVALHCNEQVYMYCKAAIYIMLYSGLHHALQWFTLCFTVVYTTLYSAAKMKCKLSPSKVIRIWHQRQGTSNFFTKPSSLRCVWSVPLANGLRDSASVTWDSNQLLLMPSDWL